MKLEQAVLVVDDERNFCRVLEAKLERSHYKVVVAFDAASALDRLLHQRFAVILLDVRLPDADGIALIAAVRTIMPGVPVLVMTAYEVDGLYTRALAAGAADVLYKPFDLNVLVDTIQRHLEAAGTAASVSPKRRRRERRRSGRVQFAAPVRITAEEPASATQIARVNPVEAVNAVVEGMTLDVSADGLAVVTSRPLPAGAAAHVAFPLDSEGLEEFGAQAIVVRAEAVAADRALAVHRLALEFTDLPTADRARLAAALADRR